MANTGDETRMGDVEELASAAELLRILECPVCTEVPLPPIYSCSRGHIVCNTCMTQLDACALCKGPFSETRNFVMENIIESSKFRCKYQNHGCPEVVKGAVVGDHHKICKFRNGPIKEKPKSPKKCNSSSSDASNAKMQSCYEWKTFEKHVPENALSGGIEEGNRLYVIRSKHPTGAIVPGRLLQGKGTAFISYNGEDCHASDFQILVVAPCSVTWETFVDGKIPDHAIIGGRDELGQILYVGRCGHKGTLALGYVFRNEKYCYISKNGTVYKYKNFEVLVKNSKGIEIDRSNM